MSVSLKTEEPQVDEGRLMRVRRVLARTRKTTSIRNDIAKNKCVMASNFFTRQQTVCELRHQRTAKQLSKSLLELRSTQKCLRRHLDTLPGTSEADSLGKYGGKSIKELKPDIVHIIQEYHPRERRVKKAARMLKKGHADGRLLHVSEAQERFEQIIGRPILIQTMNPSNINDEDDKDDDIFTRRNKRRSKANLVLPPLLANRRPSLIQDQTCDSSMRKSYTFA